MSDEPRVAGEPEQSTLAMPEPEPGEEAAAEVAFVVPAPVCESIATDEAPPVVSVSGIAVGPPALVDQAAVLDAVAELGAALGRKMDGLQALFEREARAEATREKVVDRLHAELQEYKQDLLLNILRPVFVDLIQLHDDIGKMIAAQAPAPSEGEREVRRLLEIMQSYQQAIEDILYRQGVEPFVLEETTFDPRRQRAVSTVPTEDPGLAKCIAARLRKGFQTQSGERIIRPEIVSVYSLKR
jgi:molecular chaperone GrpE